MHPFSRVIDNAMLFAETWFCRTVLRPFLRLSSDSEKNTSMQNKTIDEVSNEFRSEGHLPMHRLAESIKGEKWAARLTFDTSMLRLWAARVHAQDVEIMISYGDGRGGGRPLDLRLNSFDLALRNEGRLDTTRNIDARAVLENIRAWLETQTLK